MSFIIRRVVVCLLFVNCTALSIASPPVSPTEPLTPAEQKSKFRLPAGFEIQLVASEPEIQKPMNLAFDARGRLWVSHSIEYPFAATDPDQARDGLTVLEGIGSDGRATKATRFAERLNIPIGVLPLPSAPASSTDPSTSVIVWSIPNIWKLTDTDNDGQADKREILYGPFDFADTHGNQNAFRLAPDGWIYACHGFRNGSNVKLRGEGAVVLAMASGNTYRFKPDGSAIEQMSWGQVNPFGQAIDPLGNRFVADCHSKPIALIVRGGCYESFGKPHDGLGFVPLTTGDAHGSTGIAGVAIYNANQFPREYHGNVFVGNVVTNSIHRDIVQWRGSSPWIETPEDFVTCDDWWFRPVDLQLGPDGALYIADFYNNIIGHYEVDLKDPRRDRHRGRIWRVVWTGLGGKGTLADVTKTSVERLIELLGDSNQTVRQHALDQCVERMTVEPKIMEALKIIVAKPGSGRDPSTSPEAIDYGTSRDHTLALAAWALFRAEQLDEKSLLQMSTDSASLVRVQVMKILAEATATQWTAVMKSVAQQTLFDRNPMVRRAAAEALGLHPAAENTPSLLQAWAATPKEDVQLIHALRIALRNQLRSPSAIEQLAAIPLSEAERIRLIDIALAIPQESAAWFTFDAVRRSELSPDLMSRCLYHLGRYVDGTRLDEVTKSLQTKYRANTIGDGVTQQASLFQSLFAGLTRRGQRLSSESALGKWGVSLAVTILDPKSRPAPAWVNVPVTSAPSSSQASPWGVRPRNSADGHQGGLFFDSLSNGEALTGVLRSAPFAVPDTLSFWLCGHTSDQATTHASVNQVRLTLVDSGQVIAQQVPPGNDVAQKIEWDLKKWSGQRGMIEIIDADMGQASAWLAAGRFEPAVFDNPSSVSALENESLVVALQVAEQLRLISQLDHVLGVLGDSQSSPTVRAVAATVAMSLDQSRALTALSSVMMSGSEPVVLRATLAEQLGPIDVESSRRAFGLAFGTAPASLQQPLALALATTRPGADSLLNLVEAGKASARLLQDAPVLDRLKGSGLPDLDRRLSHLTKEIPAADERLRQQIAKFSADQSAMTISLETGAAMFRKVCANCHRLHSEGAKIGPQLDGVGQRGLERLLEDILDPNRNIDAAFRSTTISTNRGQVFTGLKLREEGAAVILADTQGKEIRIALADIEESRITALSPMPSNVVEQIGEQNLPHLIAFLLSQQQPLKEPL